MRYRGRKPWGILYGESGQGLSFERFPVKVSVATSQYGEVYDAGNGYRDFSSFTLNPTDSAAASTAMATGIKTDNVKVGFDHDLRFEPMFQTGTSMGLLPIR